MPDLAPGAARPAGTHASSGRGARDRLGSLDAGTAAGARRDRRPARQRRRRPCVVAPADPESLRMIGVTPDRPDVLRRCARSGRQRRPGDRRRPCSASALRAGTARALLATRRCTRRLGHRRHRPARERRRRVTHRGRAWPPAERSWRSVVPRTSVFGPRAAGTPIAEPRTQPLWSRPSRLSAPAPFGRPSTGSCER